VTNYTALSPAEYAFHKPHDSSSLRSDYFHLLELKTAIFPNEKNTPFDYYTCTVSVMI
jgi:hypothetical protein